MMRVITGSARGVRLVAPDGVSTRPTAERVKEAVFSMIQFDIEGRAVLDLFAGSGQMGIEALSRGARHCVLADTSPEAVTVIRKNLAATRLADRATVLAREAGGVCRDPSIGRFDIVFLDPPYTTDEWDTLLPAVAALCTPHATIVCETEADTPLPDRAGEFALVRDKRYGRARIRLYRKPLEEEGMTE